MAKAILKRRGQCRADAEFDAMHVETIEQARRDLTAGDTPEARQRRFDAWQGNVERQRQANNARGDGDPRA